jgi:hypothetical protein
VVANHGAGLPTNGRAEPILGWRLWRLRGARLESWAASYTWEPGENTARCLAPLRRCPRAPGNGCRCGFWALFSLLQCVERACSERNERSTVVGLIRGWGEVALHGSEGFRAAKASIACLLTDWPWDAPRALPEGRLAGRWRPRLRRALQYLSSPPPPEPWHAHMLREAAALYGVPLVSLEESLRIGLLEELGLDEPMRGEVRAWVEMRPR